jgi:hypothetical protein
VPPSPPAKTFAIEVVNATIRPAKLGGAPWDGFGTIPPDVINAVSTAVAASNPSAAVAIALAPIANKKFEPPDVAGTVELFVGAAVAQTELLAREQDSYVPSWHPSARFSGVILDDRVRLRVHLVDKDTGSAIGVNETDDEIGTVYVNAEQLRAALAKGAVHQVRVDDQNPQLLLVGIAVFQE